MAKQPITTLKEYFETGKRPTENQFEDLIDSFAHLDGAQIAKLIEQIDTDNGSLQLKTQSGALVAQISFEDLKNNLSGTDYGSTNENILKFTTYDASTTKIFHIKTSYLVNTNDAMYYFKATGYNYGGIEIIDITWVGYCYATYTNIINNKTFVGADANITAGQYVGTDSHVYLWFKVPDTYYTTFKIDSMRVGNGLFLQNGDLEVILSDQAQL